MAGRRFSRVPVEGTALVEYANLVTDARILDMSLQGARVELEYEFDLHKGDHIKFKGNADLSLLEFTSEVTHVHKNVVGIKVREMDFEVFVKLRNLIEERLKNSEQMVREVSSLLGTLENE